MKARSAHIGVLAFLAASAVTLWIAGCGGGGGSTMPGPQPSPSKIPQASPSPSPTIGTGCVHQLSRGNRPLAMAAHFVNPSILPQRRMFGRYPDSVVPGRVIVRLANRTMGQSVRGSLARFNAVPETAPDAAGNLVLSIPRRADPNTVAASLRQIPGILKAVPSHLNYPLDAVPNDPQFTTVEQWDMYAINMQCAWPNVTSKVAVKIAIIDTGYDKTNPDLTGKVAAGAAGSVVFDLGTGVAHAGADVQDREGHGTDVSGIAAADTNNGTYVAGVGYNVKLLEARVFPTPSASNPTPGAIDLDVAGAIDWARTHGANVINMSLGAPGGTDPVEQTAIQNAVNAGIVVVAAAGNAGQAALLYPASDPNVISVGADALNDSAAPGDPTKATEYVASYSDYGNVATPMDLIAPGGDPSGGSDSDFLHWILNLWSNTAYPPPGAFEVLIAGTSMSAPHVSGAAALIVSKNATLTPVQVRQIIDNTADNINDPHQGHGRLNVDQALFITP